jgi:hypothetical protein
MLAGSKRSRAMSKDSKSHVPTLRADLLDANESTWAFIVIGALVSEPTDRK